MTHGEERAIGKITDNITESLYAGDDFGRAPWKKEY
jgi:hypothetical protein